MLTINETCNGFSVKAEGDKILISELVTFAQALFPELPLHRILVASSCLSGGDFRFRLSNSEMIARGGVEMPIDCLTMDFLSLYANFHPEQAIIRLEAGEDNAPMVQIKLGKYYGEK